MSYCISPTCPAPDKNSPTTNFCMSCDAKILLKDRYRALSLLGQGGFGKTFKAVDEDQPRKPLCVIKQFAFSNNDPATRQIALKLFYEEAQHLATLGKHDQIPELLAYFDVEGQPYLVQQFIDGQNLEQELATAGTFNQAKIRELLESLLPVLDFLHHQSPPVIHRDIKPANIIRRRSDGGLVLVDFGAAKQATKSMLAKTGTAIGSAEFVAPEQARRKPAFASDIYSLGVTCIYLLTQVSPFDLFDMNQDAWVWRDYLVDNPMDEKLSKILDKMIANILPQRYQSAAEVLQALGIENKSKYPSFSHSLQHLSILIAPQNASDYFKSGFIREEEFQDFLGAVADYNKAIELNPKYAEAYRNRGWLKHMELDNISGALYDLNKAIELNHKDAKSYYNRASLKENNLDNMSGALADYNKAIELNPKYTDAYSNRGALKYGLDDVSGALADYSKAIELDPKCESAYNNRGMLKENELNDTSGALADYSKAIKSDPTCAIAYANRGTLKGDLNDISGALADFNKAIELDPQDIISYGNRACLKENKLNDISGALADYSKAIEINPQDAIIYGNRACLKRDKIKDRTGAIQDFQQAANLYRQQGCTEDLEEVIERLDELGATVNWW